MVYCCVPQCKNTKGRGKRVSFHEFPCNSHLREKWLKAISRQGEGGKLWSPSDRSVVCSAHFIAEDYKNGTMKRYLKLGSVPSVFPKYKTVKRKPPRRQLKQSHEHTNCDEGEKQRFQIIEEPIFVKCEQAWPLDSGELSVFEQNTASTFGSLVKKEEDPHDIVADSSLGEFDIDAVKEPCSDEVGKEEAHGDEDSNSGGSSE